jgi:hypothetical protein
MRPKRFSIAVVILSIAATSFGQTRFRSGIFLHHSTGACIWGPNGGQVSVPAEIAKYNLLHGFLASDSVKMAETWWPSGYNNEWANWHTIFDNGDSSNDIRPFLASYPVIMIKSCFPSSSMSGIGSSADSLNPTIKSVANYKWHWRSLVSVMKGRPKNFFVIWTNAPLVAGATNASEAALSSAFCRWAKDTLAVGLDPLVGPFAKNIFVFDFFHLLAGVDGMLPLQLATDSTDSHPNAAATALVAPQLAKQVFDAALAYQALTGVAGPNTTIPATPQLAQNYPNPFNPSTTIRYGLPKSAHVMLSVYNTLGQHAATLVNESQLAGYHEVRFNGSGLASGVYFYRMEAGSFVETKRLILIR